MSKLRVINIIRHIIKPALCWILLIQLINISIDPPDLVDNNINTLNREDLTINETESVYELVVEGIFNIDVPETDDNDQDQQLNTFDLYCIATYDSPIHIPFFPEEKYYRFNESLFASFQEPNSPPPKLGSQLPLGL